MASWFIQLNSDIFHNFHFRKTNKEMIANQSEQLQKKHFVPKKESKSDEFDI